ncbi:hypothetical protein BKA82DRAFT_991906 [Pisolithus tinctorius]|uniref:Uncharacterized protein n=1 Tax=Pisolithus tinctorius Marx 270 TaxID=870435 RepID=A0A0C3L081_PISTI|nr:hypothetical protein BKA82DRAFT_991906 [Pisolithus tinctorius]KIO15192.1 hypothetical protein M404DRAFT_991906 [Pisolithus tinctorius Marx 270]
MFKRVERRRKRRGDEEKLGLDEETRELLGFNETDSDESETETESGEDNQAGDDLVSVLSGEHDSEGDIDEDEDEDEESPISIEEALKDPVYLISIDPTVYGCVLCRGKIIKNADMAAVHKGSIAHKRHYDRFKALASTANSTDNAWDIVRVLCTQGNEQERPPNQLSKRALKRQAKQAALKEKRKRHKELKTKAITRKAKTTAPKDDAATTDSATTPGKVSEPVQQSASRRPAKRQKLEQIPPVLSKPQTTNKEKALRVQENTHKKSKKSTRKITATDS